MTGARFHAVRRAALVQALATAVVRYVESCEGPEN